MAKITKAVIPAAGLGTRFLPQTKAMPKEMLPIIDKPIIQYVVEDLVTAGITDIIIVTGAHKRSIEDHFDHQYELESKLRADGKADMADELSRIAEMANFIYVRQKGGLGNGVPILNAAHLLNGEPFLVLWADEFFISQTPRSQQLVEAYERAQTPIISVMPITDEDTNKYGVIKIKQQKSDDLYEISAVIEKPGPDQAPSRFGAAGGYVLTPDIIPLLAEEAPDQSGEIYLTPALDKYARSNSMHAKVVEGKWHDTGNKQKYLEAIVDVALGDSNLGPSFKSYLQNKLKD